VIGINKNFINSESVRPCKSDIVSITTCHVNDCKKKKKKLVLLGPNQFSLTKLA
jgi:hypothetical protein